MNLNWDSFRAFETRLDEQWSDYQRDVFVSSNESYDESLLRWIRIANHILSTPKVNGVYPSISPVTERGSTSANPLQFHEIIAAISGLIHLVRKKNLTPKTKRVVETVLVMESINWISEHFTVLHQLYDKQKGACISITETTANSIEIFCEGYEALRFHANQLTHEYRKFDLLDGIDVVLRSGPSTAELTKLQFFFSDRIRRQLNQFVGRRQKYIVLKRIETWAAVAAVAALYRFRKNNIVEPMSFKSYIGKLSQASGLPSGEVRMYLEEMVWDSNASRQVSLWERPIIRFNNGNVCFSPQQLLNFNYGGNYLNSLANSGQNFDEALTDEVADWMKRFGITATEIGIPISTGENLTDIDIVVENTHEKTVLLIQCKDFVEPGSLKQQRSRADFAITQAANQHNITRNYINSTEWRFVRERLGLQSVGKPEFLYMTFVRDFLGSPFLGIFHPETLEFPLMNLHLAERYCSTPRTLKEFHTKCKRWAFLQDNVVMLPTGRTLGKYTVKFVPKEEHNLS